ncbi:methyltransferase-like protein 27 isoform X2 [Glandiceps talaboti]
MAEEQKRHKDFQDNLRVIRTPGVTKHQVKCLYDEWCKHFDEDASTIYNGPKYTAEAVSKIITDKHARILDCGCGTGLVGHELQSIGYDNIDGFDMSTESLKIASTKGAYVNLMCAELGTEPIEGVQNNEYDAIVGSGFFCGSGHAHDSCLVELIRILKPGGYICQTVNQDYIHVLEGDTYKNVIDNNIVELRDKYYAANYLYNGGAYIYVMKKI